MSDEYCSTCILNVVHVDYLICIKPCEVESALNITPKLATVRIGDAVPSEHVNDSPSAVDSNDQRAASTPPLRMGSMTARDNALDGSPYVGGAIPDNIGYKRRWPAVPPEGSRTPLEDAEARQKALMLQRTRAGQVLKNGGPDRREYPNGYAIPQSARFSDRPEGAVVSPEPLAPTQVDRVRARLIEFGVEQPDFLTARLVSNPHFLAAVATFGIDQVLEMLRAHDTLTGLADMRAPLAGGKET
jgi:hypothetical protein